MINIHRLKPRSRSLYTPMLTSNTLKGTAISGPNEISIANFPRVKKPYSTCKFFFGRRGTAKSLSMVFMAWMLSNAYDEYLGGPVDCTICNQTHRRIRIAANFKCNFADIQDPYLVDKLQHYPDWAHDLVVLIDEIATYVPSARAMSKTTLELGTWLQQIRKRHIQIFMATQFPQDITRTVLRQVDYFMEPEPLMEGRHVKLFFYDIWGQFSGDYSYKKWPPTREDSFNEKTLPFTNRVWGEYDTEEIFQPIWAGSRRDEHIDKMGWEFDNPAEAAALNADAQRLVLPPGYEEEEVTLDNHLSRLLERGDGESLRLGHVFGDVRKLFQDEVGWKTTRDMEDDLAGRGWIIGSIGTGQNHRYAVPAGMPLPWGMTPDPKRKEKPGE